MSPMLPEPTDGPYDLGRRLCDYLDFFRVTVAAKLEPMPAETLRSSPLPSRWTPLELANHLVHMERRWLVWGFLAEPVDQPWGDEGPDGRWAVPPHVPLAEILAELTSGGRRTTAIVAEHALTERARTGGRFDAPTRPPWSGSCCTSSRSTPGTSATSTSCAS